MRAIQKFIPLALALCIYAGVPCTAEAQHPNHAAVVAAVKAELEARGVDLSGSCGAFAITKRVAWRLRQEGAGTLSKPSGNNCEGMSVDYILYQDGNGYDVLGDAGTANTPGWGGPETGMDPLRWRAPLDPGDPAGTPSAPVPMPAPQPAPSEVPAPVDLGPVVDQLRALEAQLTDLQAQLQQLLDKPAPAIALPAIVFPTYRGSTVFGSITLRPQP